MPGRLTGERSCSNPIAMALIRILEQGLDRPDEERSVTSQPGAVNGRYTADGKWLLYKVETQGGAWKLMRMPASAGLSQAGLPQAQDGLPQLVLDNASMRSFFCTTMPVNFCAVAIAEPNQLVFHRLDPAREPPAGGFTAAQLPELARTDYKPTDWGIAPDGSRLALVRPDPGEARIHIISLNGQPVSDVMVRGWTALQTLNWALGGNGWYVSSRMNADNVARTPAPFAHVDPAGNATLLESPDSFFPSWGIPSPDGRHFAFAGAPATVNVWLIESF